MKFCKPFWKKHVWQRYDELVEQLMVGGFYAWQRCPVCKHIKFDSAKPDMVQELGWVERKKELDRLMGWTIKEYK